MLFDDIDLEVTMQSSTSLLILFSRKTFQQNSKNYSVVLNFSAEAEATKFYETLKRIHDELEKKEHSYKEW